MSRLKMNRTQMPSMAELVETLKELPPFSLVGFEITKGARRLHVGDFPTDPRASAAGLFGASAPRSWFAAGVTFTGTARALDSLESVGDVVTGVVVTRDRGIASYMEMDGRTVVTDNTVENTDAEPSALVEASRSAGRGPMDLMEGASPTGGIVDALHRMLGLSSPGQPPHAAYAVTSIWLDDVMEALFTNSLLSWADIARLHPLACHNPAIPPSDEMIVEASCRAHEQFSWKRIHSRAMQAESNSCVLTPSEIRWMDTTMYARWVIAALPDIADVANLLRQAGRLEEAARIEVVIGEVFDRVHQQLLAEASVSA